MAAGPSLTEHLARSSGHCSFYLAGGEEGRADHLRARLAGAFDQLAPSAARASPASAFAPSRRTCAATAARASIRGTRTTRSAITRDMIELLDCSGARRRSSSATTGAARWSGAWRSHHPDRCHGVANLCVPYIPDGFAPDNIIKLADRNVYPEADYPAGAVGLHALL